MMKFKLIADAGLVLRRAWSIRLILTSALLGVVALVDPARAHDLGWASVIVAMAAVLARLMAQPEMRIPDDEGGDE